MIDEGLARGLLSTGVPLLRAVSSTFLASRIVEV